MTNITVSHPALYVAHVELNRPDKLNAFAPHMWGELREAFEALSSNPDVRAIVLSGAGDRAFTAGLDLVAAGQMFNDAAAYSDASRSAKHLRRHIEGLQACVTAVEACEKPVICAMHGIALGLAIDISCCCDIRLCAADTRFSVKEIDIGLAADIGTLARLPKIVGSASWVKDVCLTAREFHAPEAQAVGFVSRVLPSKADTIAAALETASHIAAKSPVAVQGTKQLLNHARDHTVADNLHYTAVWNSSALQSDDVSAAMTSGMKKTKPEFAKL